MFGVRLGEHHQLDVVGIAPHLIEALHQVVDLVLGQRQAELEVGALQRGATAAEHVDHRQRFGLGVTEQPLGLLQAAQHQLGHAVVQGLGDQRGAGIVEFAADVVGDPPFEAFDLRQAAVAGDVGGLARPRRDGAEARHHQEQPTARLLHRHAGAVLEQPRQHALLLPGEDTRDLGEVGKLGVHAADGGHRPGQLLEQFAVAEGGKGGSAAQDQHLRDSLGEGGFEGRVF
ncbi:hypothetical protein D9M69_452060 [compost metagenome]